MSHVLDWECLVPGCLEGCFEHLLVGVDLVGGHEVWDGVGVGERVEAEGERGFRLLGVGGFF